MKTPDTHPEEFRQLTSCDYVQKGDLFKLCTGWTETSMHGLMAPEFYYRRKQQPKEQMKITWNPIENGPPVNSKTVLVAYGPPQIFEDDATEFSVGYYGLEGQWYSGSLRSKVDPPKFWAHAPAHEIAPLNIIINEGNSGRQHQVVFNPDGSITVGCTTVQPSQMKAIIKKYQEVNK